MSSSSTSAAPAPTKTDYTFRGYVGLSKTCVQDGLVLQEFEPKPWTEDDVDIKVSHCGVCGSDIHTLRSGWGETMYPVCVGHEIVGECVRVGANVKHAKVGMRLGVGAQCGSCLSPSCPECTSHHESYCQNGWVGTYNSKYPEKYFPASAGAKSYGGYSNYVRVPGHFAVPIPDGLESKDAASMLCGGVTTYSPLQRHGCGPGKRVGIVGVGGLGHYGVLFAKALGAEHITAISRKADKREDALKMGADVYIATDDEPDWWKTHRSSVDLIVCTVSSPKMPLERYLGLLRVRGVFIQVGAPEDALPPLRAGTLLSKDIKLGGSMIGSPKEIGEMLQLAVDKGVKPWVVERKMEDCSDVVREMENEGARYRFVLTNPPE